MGVIEGSNPRVQHRRVVIERNAVRTLNATAVELVPAAGSFRTHLVHMVYIHKRSGTAYALAGAGELIVRYTGGDGDDITQFDASDFSSSASRRRVAMAHSSNSGNADKDVRDNHGIELHLSGAAEYTGGATTTPFEVDIFYQTVDE